MNMLIDSESLDRIVLTARVLRNRLRASLNASEDGVDNIVAASMPAIIALTAKPPRSDPEDGNPYLNAGLH